MRPRPARRFVLLLAAALVALPTPASADERGDNDFRISTMGPDGDTDYRASAPAVAYSPPADRYLVVWSGDDDTGLLVQGENEIHGQLIVGATGATTGPDDPLISATGGLGDADFAAFTPDVVYNSVDNRFLVVWAADTDEGALVDGEFEIWGRIVDSGLNHVGSDFRISFMGPDGSPAWEAEHPAAAYNPARNEYVVVWSGDTDAGALVDDEYEIWAQRLSASGALLGGNFRISDMGGSGNAAYDALRPDVVFNTRRLEYLIVWYGDDDTAPLVDHEYEVYGQRIDEFGAGLGANDVRLSDAGGSGDPDFGANLPTVAYNPIADQYLVVWQGTDTVDGMALHEIEVFAQRLSATLGGLGANDFRLSDVGGLGNTDCEIWTGPDVAFNPSTQRYLVTWTGSDTVDGMATNEIEAFAQLLNWDGQELGPNDERISDAGGLGDARYGVYSPGVAANSRSGEFLVAWEGEDDVPPQVLNEFEILCQRMDSLAIFIDGFEAGDTTNWSSTSP